MRLCFVYCSSEIIMSFLLFLFGSIEVKYFFFLEVLKVLLK